MGRPLRVWAEGSVYHLFSRGSDRRTIFDEAVDYAHFTSLLRGYAEEYELECFCWTLMPNHWHLMARSSARGLSQFVRCLNHRYSLRTNRSKGRTAHLFQNRFGAVEQESTAQFLWTLRYVLRNPVEAGLCASVADWRWTSFHDTVDPSRAPSFLRVDEILGYFGAPGEKRTSAFAAYLSDLAS
jgi:REP element-mobilizing transposase RayT